MNVASPAGAAPSPPESTGNDTRAVAPRRGFIRRLLRRPLAAISLAYLCLITLACILAPVISPYSPLDQDLNAIMGPPSAHHPLGTDDLGRDVLSRLLYGGRASLLGVLEAVVVLAVVGTLSGLLAGYFGGWADWTISRIVDVVMAIPVLVVILGVLAIFGNSMLSAMVVFGLLGSAGLARIVRGATLAVRQELYVAAAKVSGVSRPSIVLRHVLPRLAGPVIVQLSLLAGVALGVQSGLAFLNLGIVLPAPSWGGMVGTASQLVSEDPWLLVPPGVVIALTILAFSLIGDAARDVTVEAWSNGQSRQRRRRRGPKAGESRPAAPAVALGSPVGAGAVLSIRDLTVAFGSDKHQTVVADRVSLDVCSGEVVALVGESGSGKTITALAILGLLPASGHVLSGTVMLDGRNLLEISEKQLQAVRGSKIGLISQEPMSSLDPAFRVGSQLAEVIRQHEPVSRRTARGRAIEMLRTVRLPDPEEVMHRYPYELSGGMAQRVVIALALAASPELLIADEPTTALDVTVQAEILDLLRSLQQSRRMAVIFVTHNLAVVADLCSRAIVMQGGRVVENCDVETLFARPQHAYTKALLSATPSLISLDAAPGGAAIQAADGKAFP